MRGMGNHQPILSCSNIGKKFRGSDRWAVRHLSFGCRRGEIIGLIGENGAGKTTTLRLLATMLSANEGEACVCGWPLKGGSREIRRSVGILFGGISGLYERLSARENIRYFAHLNGMEPAATETEIERLAGMLEMREYLDRRAGTFSSGMRQKTLIARTIIHNPSLLLLDEPATGLDLASARTVYRFIEDCRELGKSVLFSSHDLAAVERISDTVLVLHRGALAASAPPAEIAAGGSLEEGYFHLTGEAKG